MWVDHEPVDDGYISKYLIVIHEVHVFELPIEMNFMYSHHLTVFLTISCAPRESLNV